METPPPDTRILPFPSHHGTRYDPETRDRARESWFFLDGRNAEAVARRLQPECPGLDARTVRRWAAEGQWADWGRRRVSELAPGIYEAVVVELVAGSLEGATYLRNAARGTAKAEPARVNASVALLDRAGLRPRDAALSPKPEDDAPVDASPKTPADLAADLRRMMEARRKG